MKKNIFKTILIIAVITMTMACNTENTDLQTAGINIIVDQTDLTRAVKTTFDPGDEIELIGTFNATYTMQLDGTWTTPDIIPALPLGEFINIYATHGDRNARPRTDCLEAYANNTNADGNITLAIGPDGKPVWNIRLKFTHAYPAVDVIVKNADDTNITTDVQAIEITTTGPEEVITTANPTGIFLEPGCAIADVAVTIAGIKYKATTNTNQYLAAGKRYTLTFTANPLAPTINITPNNDPSWNIKDPTVVPPGYDYYIYDKKDLAAWAADPTNRNRKAIQMADIDWEGADWTPVGDDDPFTGTYNGNGYTIIGLNIKTEGTSIYAGMFGYVSGALLANIHLRQATITGQAAQRVGLLAGYTAGNATISLCSAQGTITCHNDNLYIGGLIGFSTATHTTRCYADATITGTPRNDATIGGLIGYGYSSIVACGANANIDVTTTNTCYAGGLTGLNDLDTQIYFCYATGNVTVAGTSDNRHAGGLTGYNNTGTINHSYATANATGTTDKTGSLVGLNNGAIFSCHATGTANGDLDKPVAGGTNGNVSTNPANRRTQIRADVDINAPTIRTVISNSDGSGSISAATRIFYSGSVWTTGDLPGINYNYSGSN